MKKIIFISVCLLLSACSSTKEMQPVALSKADATIKMGYLVEGRENADIDLNQVTEVAAKRCALWDYSGAEPFGTVLTTCLKIQGGTCILKRVTLDFQCTK